MCHVGKNNHYINVRIWHRANNSSAIKTQTPKVIEVYPVRVKIRESSWKSFSVASACWYYIASR